MRDKSRFNKLVLIRLAPEDLGEDVRKHAAEGVLAYSAICTHQGCTVSGWEATTRSASIVRASRSTGLAVIRRSGRSKIHSLRRRDGKS